MKSILTPALIYLILLSATGCGLQLPRLRSPGNLYQQQLRATFHDPYGQTDNAPEIEGGRPPTFEQPRPQSARSQWFFDSQQPF